MKYYDYLSPTAEQQSPLAVVNLDCLWTFWTVWGLLEDSLDWLGVLEDSLDCLEATGGFTGLAGGYWRIHWSVECCLDILWRSWLALSRFSTAALFN
ncbi:hypothetical protein Pcinc_009643 [Petrolisthes cinctipes]|uniref:Uncharacterized protein n=1 Tax=Petrolisthes cinctipes TaxID=88211 RepID=A0AAE1G4A9_PETCI|nr:hypothetical protein Pcinc_009643 [Petrolisthes cinctipes]